MVKLILESCYSTVSVLESYWCRGILIIPKGRGKRQPRKRGTSLLVDFTFPQKEVPDDGYEEWEERKKQEGRERDKQKREWEKILAQEEYWELQTKFRNGDYLDTTRRFRNWFDRTMYELTAEGDIKYEMQELQREYGCTDLCCAHCMFEMDFDKSIHSPERDNNYCIECWRSRAVFEVRQSSRSADSSYHLGEWDSWTFVDVDGKDLPDDVKMIKKLPGPVLTNVMEFLANTRSPTATGGAGGAGGPS